MDAPSPTGGPLRIAVVCEGDPSDPTEWSGTPFGIVGGLNALGVDVVPVAGAPSGRTAALFRDVIAVAGVRPEGIRSSGIGRALRVAREVAPLTATYGNLGTAWVWASLRRRGPVDGVVQIGSSYEVRHPRVVTFEDMTVRQAIDEGQYRWGVMSSLQIEKRIARQRRVYEQAVAVTVATPWAGRSVVSDYGIPCGKVAAVGFGRNHHVAPVEREWGSPRFLFVGVDWERKNGDAVVAAFREVRKLRPDATLDLVGGHPPVDECGVVGHGRLRLDDPTDGEVLAGLFASSTCLVMPSRFEAGGIVYLEAAAAGLPVIGTTKGGAPDLIGPGGFVVDPLDQGALVTAMVQMCEKDIARAFGARAAQRVAAFTWEMVAARLLDAMGFGFAEAQPVSW